jgi:methyl-accepting chemotaxis protein
MVAALCCTVAANAQQAPIHTDAGVALSSLIALTDAHLRAESGAFEVLAATPQAKSGDWVRIEPLLAAARGINKDAVLYFALPSGSYWIAGKGLQPTKLTDRQYFTVAMSGRESIGESVISRSMNVPAVVVAVPVIGPGGKVLGMFGASIPLASLSAVLRAEMGLAADEVFFAIDAHAVIQLHSDPSNIFIEPGKMSPTLARVTSRMLSEDEGTQTYEYRGRTRTVLYRKSSLTGWRFGFGIQQ